MGTATTTGKISTPKEDPVADLADGIRLHIETDGREPLDPSCGIGVLLLGVTDPRTAAAILYLAHDEVLYGDRQEAAARVLRVANAMAGTDEALAMIRRFYALAG
jgi:acetylornithine/succinyldiaminopimelate/putrescine aminotransferase